MRNLVAKTVTAAKSQPVKTVVFVAAGTVVTLALVKGYNEVAAKVAASKI